MRELDRRQDLFEKIADAVVREILRPRFEKLTEFFPHGQLSQQNGAPHCACTFPHNADFPASVELDIGIGHDEELNNLLLLYSLEVRPVFIHIEDQHVDSFTLIDCDLDQLAARVDERILEFVDTYLRIGETDQYLQETLVTDPVCKMRFRKQLETAEETFQGKRYHFCSEHCRKKFTANPETYVATELTVVARPLPGEKQLMEIEREKADLEKLRKTINELEK